jgi:rubrerythrin
MGVAKGWTWEAAIDRAILMEKQSHSLYSSALKIVRSPGSRSLLGNLANDELQHKAKLENVKRTRSWEQLGPKAKDLIDLEILDRVEDVRLSEDATYEEILIFAGKREKETHEYYLELSARLEGTPAGELFSHLAKEELGHKAKIEKEYESIVLKEG